MVRFILNCGHMKYIGQSERNSLGFLSVSDRIEQLRLNNLFKVRNCLNPDYLSEGLDHVSNIYKVNTWSSAQNYFVQQVRVIALNTFSNKGSKDWNGLPEQI